jgi:ATP-dependent DNA ligase
VLANIGVIGAFPMQQRRALVKELEPLVTTFDRHPWNWEAEMAAARTPRERRGQPVEPKKDLMFVPAAPERVVEIRYDHMEGDRLRHTGQFVRWRPDRDPRSCTFDQLDEPVSFDLAEILGD